jgi:hypothetical protein
MLECAACLDVLHIAGAVTAAEIDTGKTILSRAVGLLIGLIKSKMPDHWLAREAEVEYRVGPEANE